MILVCPSCKASYLVPASIFSRGARKVKCARCAHDWMADLPSRQTAVPASSPQETQPPPAQEQPAETPEHTKPSPANNLPAIWKNPRDKIIKFAKYGSLALAGLSLLALLAIYKDSLLHLVSSPPPPPAHHEDQQEEITIPGFSLLNVKSERRYQDGSMRLWVEGSLFYEGDNDSPVPDILVEALDPKGKKIKEWTVPAQKDEISPQESLPFSTSINTPEGTVVEIKLRLVPKPVAAK